MNSVCHNMCTRTNKQPVSSPEKHHHGQIHHGCLLQFNKFALSREAKIFAKAHRFYLTTMMVLYSCWWYIILTTKPMMKMEIQWFICQFWSLCLCMRWNRQMFEVNEWMNYLSIIITAAQTNPIKTNWFFWSILQLLPSFTFSHMNCWLKETAELSILPNSTAAWCPKGFNLQTKITKQHKQRKGNLINSTAAWCPKGFNLQSLFHEI